ncbi:glycoprotein A33 (transmembrane), paralog a [Neoarius graeffei]|uniref:glycoprotein A33 (transmembrane), paralog a n=1 Tax=Neoarius graeffei TaxID=443677 RepID=UPI00298D262A|nr:glycoprotein A33 (transmembrane), paralog a [Neoarius graeffei]
MANFALLDSRKQMAVSSSRFELQMMVQMVFFLIHLASSLTVDIPKGSYDFARGDSAVIPCKFLTKITGKPVIILWTAEPDNPDDPAIDILTYYDFADGKTELDISSEYEGRASLKSDIGKGWANLTMASLVSKDSRDYECEVRIPGDSEGQLSDVTQVVVLVAPSKPICAIEGKAEYYQDIKLTCHSKEGTPAPTYVWQSYDVSNNSRPNPPKSTDVNGILSLYNISKETSGYYKCTSSNKIRSETCELTLSVMPFSMNIGSTAAIIGGGVAGLFLLVLIICCCCRRYRRKKEAEEYALKAPVNEEYTDKEPQELEVLHDERTESKANRSEREERSDRYDDRQGRPDNRQHDSDRYDDRRSDRYDDRRSDYDDRRSDYDDRRSDRYDDRRSDYDDRRSDYDDRRSDRYDDRRRDRYDDRRDRYDDRRDRYDDRRDRYDDRRDR